MLWLSVAGGGAEANLFDKHPALAAHPRSLIPYACVTIRAGARDLKQRDRGCYLKQSMSVNLT